ncbi:hypothetical protein WL96_15245 (plasmid) [Burkholderia vietnamiensis]|uniref:Uncharacterized protein n=2 Tax=Burkholderiaceae TaxID=119060 RepID=A0AA44Y4H5_BURVI|nr:hypothetical protein WL96_15245 [Burkholderia vietnamiensis]KVR89986.1 hypothetical protein WK28_23325 [Burkholderia vietnamiensis]KVS11248.1 hypothetical protein WK29_19070 [Burkholderia vietnamiensis]KVS21195.1 hypothetical protein WK34_22730 [Burkholderia vietnamiensis]PRH43700.1 hypothetical protein C6T65_03555 [Burkholderia vietnamiensis]
MGRAPPIWSNEMEYELGPVPYEEACEQVGTPDYNVSRARHQCAMFIRQLERVFRPARPDSLSFVRKSFPHEFGTYFEVVAIVGHDDGSFSESAVPARWDYVAQAELLWWDRREAYRVALDRSEITADEIPPLYRRLMPTFPDSPEACGMALGEVPLVESAEA